MYTLREYHCETSSRHGDESPVTLMVRLRPHSTIPGAIGTVRHSGSLTQAAMPS